MQQFSRICKEHKQEIILYCDNVYCNHTKILCNKCLQEGNHQHLQNLQSFQKMAQFINQQRENSSLLIKQLYQQIDKTKVYLKKLEKGIEEKYSITQQQIQNLNTAQVDQYITNAIQFDKTKNDITQSILIKCEQLNQQIDHCLNSLELEEVLYKQEMDEAEQFYQLGFNLYWDYENNEEALKCFDLALQTNKNHFNSLWCKGAVLRQMNQFDEAIVWYDKALKINKNHVMSLYGKGEALRGQEKHEESLQWYNKALLLEKDHYLSHYGKGEALRRLKRYDEALQSLDKSLKYFPNHSIAMSSKGACLIQQKKIDEALKCLEQSQRIDSKSDFTKSLIKICERELKK